MQCAIPSERLQKEEMQGSSGDREHALKSQILQKEEHARFKCGKETCSRDPKIAQGRECTVQAWSGDMVLREYRK